MAVSETTRYLHGLNVSDREPFPMQTRPRGPGTLAWLQAAGTSRHHGHAIVVRAVRRKLAMKLSSFAGL